ncbi:hypothetical protein NKDENANG_03075 [Candidatus Entotheonellaceae bacterium PAL068K]
MTVGVEFSKTMPDDLDGWIEILGKDKIVKAIERKMGDDLGNEIRIAMRKYLASLNQDELDDVLDSGDTTFPKFDEMMAA